MGWYNGPPMAVRKIIKFPSPSLAVPCREVQFPLSEELREHIRDLRDTLDATANGVALASNQIVPEGWRVFVVKPDVWVPGVPSVNRAQLPLVVINPTWTVYPPHQIDEILVHHYGREHFDFVEGCLSIPEVGEKIRRQFWTEMEYQDETGAKLVYIGAGLGARIIQHECDHLDGRLIVDHLDDRKRIFIRNQAIKNRKAGR